MKKEKQLDDFEGTDKKAKKLDQIKGGGGGTTTGVRIPPGGDE